MLSADVPEFIPKALRNDGQAATRTNAEEDGSSSLAADALQTKPDLADESPSSTSKECLTDVASCDVNFEEEHHLSDKDGLAKHSLPCKMGMVVSSIHNEESNILNLESNLPVLEVDQDAGITADFEDQPASPAAAASVPVTQGDGESPVIASSLRATSAEFFPAGMYLGYNSPANSPGPQMSYTGSPSPHNSPGFMYPNGPPFYYEPNSFSYCCDSNWVHDLDYNQGFYNPILNAGHYSAGEYFVPNGGYMFEGGDGGYPQQPPPGAGHMVEQTYFDPNLAAEYSGGFVDVPGSGAIGRGGGTAGGGAPGGAPGGYNKKYPNKNRQKRPPDHGGGRGAAGAGGSRQPSNEMRICGQTGELTLGKRRPQGNTSQGGRGSAHQQVKVQASTIISNVKNWPTLNMGKVEKEKSIVFPSANDGAPVVAANEHDRAAVCKIVEPTVANCVQPPPAISFSSIAKKQSDVTEPAFFSLKQSNPGPSAVKAKKKDLLPNKTSGDHKKMKGAQNTPVSEVETDSSKKSGSNESTTTKSETEWTYKGKQPNSVKATPLVMENLQQEVMRQPNSSVNLTPMTKSAKKKAKKNKKLLAAAAVAGLVEESSIESTEITMRASPIGNNSEDVVLLAIVDEEPSVSVIPEKSKIVSEWLNKDVSSTAPKYSKLFEESQPNAKTHKEKKFASDDVENKAVTSNVSSSVNSTVKETDVLGQKTVESSSTKEAQKTATTMEEFTWFTVGKRSKSKKAPLPKEIDQISLSQNRKSYKVNSKRDKQNAPQGSTVLARTNIAIQEIAQKVGSASGPTTKVVVNAPKEDSSSSYGFEPKVVSAPKDGSSNSSNAKPKVVSKTETSAQISSPEGDPKKELDKVEFLSETTVRSTTVELKKRDLNDLEVQKIMKHREIRKENIKREGKLNGEAAALEKKAMAKKDTKISVMPALSPKSAVTQVTAAESFAIKSEEYPSLGAKKAPKSQIDKSDKNLKKDAVRKINGIIQINPEQVVTNVETKSQDESNAVALSNVWTTGSKNAPAITTSSQDSIKSISTISLPSPAPAEESVGVRRKVLSYSLAAASVPAATSRDLKTRSGSTAPAEATKKGTVTVRAKKNVQPPTRSKQVKYSDKLEIDLRNLLVIKPSRLKRGQASSIVSQAVASRTARRTTGARPVRVLTTTVGKQPRIKGQKRKGPTAIQRYKRFHALHRQDLLLLLADLKRRQDAEQKTDINTEGFREENSNKSQTSSSDLSNSTNNTSIPVVSICSSLLSNKAATCFNSSASGLADTSNSADDAGKSSNKKCKRNKKSSNTADSSNTAAEDSSTKSLQVVAVIQDMPEGVVASAVVAVEQKEAVAHKPLSPAEAKEIADRLADELEKMQGTKKKIVKTNVITQELNDHIAALLIDIVRFQRRSYFHDQIKAKAKRRFVSGIKEVQKKLHKIQLLVVAQDVGRAIPMVADSAAALLKEAEAQHVPVVFALNRGRIGRLTRKESGFKISCVGILNFQGAEDSVKGIMSILPELKRRQQLINDSKKGDTITNSILEEVEEEEEEDSSSLACDGDSGPSSSTVTSSSSSNQSTPAKVSAASIHGSKSSPQVMRGKNGIRQMTAVTGKLSGAVGLGTTPFTTVAASLEVNDKIVSILKEQENHVSNENQTS